MNDYYTAQGAGLSDAKYQAMKQAQYEAQSFTGGRVEAGSIVGGPRPAMATLGSILEQMQKLTAMSNELAVRIVGQMPEANEASAGLASDPMNSLATAADAIERAVHRAEQNLSRALNGL